MLLCVRFWIQNSHFILFVIRNHSWIVPQPKNTQNHNSECFHFRSIKTEEKSHIISFWFGVVCSFLCLLWMHSVSLRFIRANIQNGKKNVWSATCFTSARPKIITVIYSSCNDSNEMVFISMAVAVKHENINTIAAYLRPVLFKNRMLHNDENEIYSFSLPFIRLKSVFIRIDHCLNRREREYFVYIVWKSIIQSAKLWSFIARCLEIGKAARINNLKV